MKKWKKNAGFSLVELIIVIAILAILAAIAIPAYSGYIKKANQTADITVLDAVKTAAMAYYAEEGSVNSLYVNAAENKVYINGGEEEGGDGLTTDSDFLLYYMDDPNGTFDITLKTGDIAIWSADENGGKWTISDSE